MAFSDVEIARYAGLIEKLIWAKRRPSLHLRDKSHAPDRASDCESPLRKEPGRMASVLGTGGHEVAPVSSPAGSEIARRIPQAGRRGRKWLF
jgi:hypothetical protein